MTKRRVNRLLCLAIMPLLSGCSLIFGDGPGVRAGLTYNWANFTRFQGMVGDQEGIATAHSDETIDQLGIIGELLYGKWFYGAEFRFGQHDWTQTFQQSAGLPDRGHGTVDGYFLDLSGGRRWRLNPRLSAGLWTGPMFTYDRGRSVWDYDEDDIEDERSLSSIKWALGGNLDVGLMRRWIARVGWGHGSGHSDADDHDFWRIGVLRDFGTVPEFYQRPGKVSGTPYEKAIVARLHSLRRSSGRGQP